MTGKLVVTNFRSMWLRSLNSSWLRCATSALALCAASAVDVAAAPIPVDLSTWTVVQYELFDQPDASWVLSESNTVATQVVNADASILLSDFDLTNSEIVGTWRVDTTTDDDFIGFVFAYQSRCAFYLFDWKKALQDVADVGMSVKVINTCPGDPDDGDLWTTPAPSPGPLLRHNQVPWVSYTDYRFRLLFAAGEFTIAVTRVSDSVVLESWTVQDATYDGGGFGFYNYSQSDVRYAGFTVAPDAACGDNVVDAEAGEECDDGNNVDGDCCTFNCLVETMPGCVDTTTTTTTTTLLETTTTTLEPPTTTTLPVCPNLCGDPAPVFGLITAVDAGAILRASVSLWECPLCVCDVDNGGTVMASDALADLQFAVGLHVGLACPELLIVGSAR